MKRLRARNLNLLISLTTLAVLLLAGAAYYYLYTERREARLHERHFRVLHRMGENMLALNETYISNAVANGAKSVQTLKEQVLNIVNEEINRVNQSRQIILPKARIDPNFAFPTPTRNFPPIPASTVSILPNKAFKISSGDRTYVLSFEKFTQKYRQRTQLDYSLTLLSREQIQARNKEGNTVHLKPRNSQNGWEIEYTLPISSGSDDQGGYQLSLSRPMDEFMSTLLREDVFEEFIILRREKDSKSNEDLQVVYESFGSYFVPELIAQNLDSLLSMQIEANQGAELINLPYLTHLQPLSFNDDQLILCGLVELNQFKREKRRISTFLVLVLLLLVLLIVLAIPILKLRLISPRERMKISDLVFASSSAIFGSSLIVLLFFDLYNYNGPGKEVRKQQLVDLSSEISESFFEELEAIYDQLTYYDTLSIPHDETVLEILAVDSTQEKLWPSYYPYFTSIYWATLADSIGLEWSVRSEASPDVSLAGRSYLEGVKEGRTWALGSDGANKRFLLESLLTRTTGDNLGVVSKPSRTLIPFQSTQEPAPVIFLTSYLYSVIQPVLPSGFGFAIVDEKGKVWFHSEQQRNLQQNLIEEADNSDLKAAIYSRSALYTDGNYMGEDYDFYLRPLDQLPLYLVTFRKKIFDRSTHEQIISLSFLLTFLSFLVGLGFVFLLIIFNPSSQVLKQDRFTFDWLRPTRMNRNRYQVITIANLIILILAIVFTRDSNAPVALSIIAASFIYAFLIAFFLLNRNSRNEFQWQSHRQIVFTTLAGLVLLNLLLNAVLTPVDALRVRLYQMVPGFILLVIISRLFYRYLNRRDRRYIRPAPVQQGKNIQSLIEQLTNQWRKVENWVWNTPSQIERRIMQLGSGLSRAGFYLGTQRSYRFFLLSWLAIIGFFPVVKFYEVAYNREYKLQIQHTQIQFAKDLQKRNEAIDQRYLEIRFREGADDNPWKLPGSPYRTSSRRSYQEMLKDSLKSQGLYSQSYYQTRFMPSSPLNLTELEINFPVWQDTLDGLTEVLAGSEQSFLVELKFDSCVVSRTFSRFDKQRSSDVAPVFPNQTPYQVNWSVELLRDNRLAFQIDLMRRHTVNEDPDEEARRLAQELEDGIKVRLFVNQSNRGDSATLVQAKIQTALVRQQENDTYFFLDSLLSIVRPRYNELVRRSNYLNNRFSADGEWGWTLQRELVKEHSALETENSDYQRQDKLAFQKQDGLQLVSLLPAYQFPSLWGENSLAGWRFWGFFLVLVVITYLLIDFAVYRFFAQNTLNLSAPDAVSTRKILRETRENIFLVVPPRPLETEYLSILEDKVSFLLSESEETVKLKQSEYLFDLSRKNERSRLQTLLEANLAGERKLPPLLVLDNFEADPDRADICMSKLLILDQLFSLQTQVVLLSTQEPLELSQQFAEASTTEEDKPLDSDLRPTQRQWSQVLSHFNQLYYPLEKWKVHNQQTEAWDFISGRHSFLYLAQVSYRRNPLEIAGVSVQLENGEANMEKGKDYEDFQVIRLDHGVNTPHKLSQKLKKLERWIESKKHAQITILSSLNPQEILRTYDNRKTDYREVKMRWKRVFDSFHKSILSVRPRSLRMKDRIREIIRRECAHGKFLQGIQEELAAQLKTPGSRLSKTLLEEEVILQIGIRANLYYHALWNACSQDEQLLIYDLAQDGLINSRNLKAVESLLRKGIFVTDDDTIHLMNRSFRNFVLTVVNPEEALQMEAQIRQDATWSRAKIPLAIIVFSLAAFLFYTDISAVIDETAAFIAAVTALLPLISKVVAGVTSINVGFQKLIPNFRNRKSED
jgi:hypothetical protein